ncbi:enolase C-terminal domain-like protein [Terrabacter lapilli]|uniref:Enolase C-terminal domain-like protein n=1 Tax=Terrabacter lapilli TaxID=436231 RepID=A0ABN2S4V6_9MICO
MSARAEHPAYARDDSAITGVGVAVYRFPTPEPEGDGTFEWHTTTAVTVTLEAAGFTGLGWTYSSRGAAAVVDDELVPHVLGRSALDVTEGWSAMRRAVRNLGGSGLAMQAISAVDVAWWDLKARLLGVPLGDLLGRCSDDVPVYGSGGFTTLDDAQLAEQVEGWAEAGCAAMKIKIGESWGSDPARDLHRTRQLRRLAPEGTQLMVDANGGYTVGEAIRVGDRLDALGVVWFEEPVSSDDTEGLTAVREALACDVAAGEYAATPDDVTALLPVVDCLQLDATRCGGYTGWLRAASLAEAAHLQVSAHCAPSLHAVVAAAVPNLRHVEWFVDHVRLEARLLDGIPEVSDGALHPRHDGPGHGMTVSGGAEQWRVA